MGVISIILNVITLIFVVLLLLKDKTSLPTFFNEKLTISATQVFNTMLSDDNAIAANRAEQPVNTNGSLGDFTNFDSVDYEMEKHIHSYDINAETDKIDTSLPVKSTTV